LRKTTKTFSYPPERQMNPESPKFKTGVPITQLRNSSLVLWPMFRAGNQLQTSAVFNHLLMCRKYCVNWKWIVTGISDHCTVNNKTFTRPQSSFDIPKYNISISVA